MSRRLPSLFLFPCLLIAAGATAQTVDVSALIDRAGSAPGCSVQNDPSLPVITGIDARLTATADAASGQVTSLTLETCSAGTFGAPQSLPQPPYPVGLNNGSGGSDVVEMAVAAAEVAGSGSASIAVSFVADGDGSVDEASGGFLGIVVPVPISSLTALLLALAIAGVAFFVLRRQPGLAVVALCVVSVAAWAAHFMLDGEIGDWTGVAPVVDPAGDTTAGGNRSDIVAAFLDQEDGMLFFRVDLADIENTAPVAADGADTTDEDTPVTVTLTGSDVEGDPLTFAIGTGPANGSLGAITQINPTTAEAVYTPAADFNGADSFTFTVNDGSVDSVPATISLTVNPVNDAPVASGDTAQTNEDQSVGIDVLANDSDIDGNLDPSSVTITAAPANGSAAVNTTTGVITYTKAVDFNGTDSFGYEVCDDGTPLPSLCATTAVSITIDAVNDPPVANANAASTDEDTPVTVTLTGSDVEGDPLTFAIGTGPASGSLGAITQINPTTAEAEYTPAADFNGGDSFTFTANDGTDDSALATISLTVNPINDPPTADAGAASTDEDTPVTITLTGSDVDGDLLTFAIGTGPANGSLGTITQINPTTAEVVYASNADFNGADSFTFTVNDGTVDSAAATISLTVNAVNDPPMADASMATTEEDTPVTITLTGSDVDGNPLTFGIETGPANGSLGAITQLSPTTAEVVYTPNAAFVGADSFTFTAFDGTVDSGAAMISITVTPGNDPPVANDAFVSTDEDNSITITLTGSDADSDPLTFAIVGGPANGLLGAITPLTATSASVAYTPDADFNGADSFMFTVNDGTVTSPAATVSLTVNPINDPPVAQAKSGGNVQANMRRAAIDLDLLTGVTDADSGINGCSPTFSVASVNSGTNGTVSNVNLAAGTFDFEPAPGYTGAASASYTVSDSGCPGMATSATQTISFNVVGPVIWFVDPNLASNGSGSLSSPFNSLASANTAKGTSTSERIFVYSGTTASGTGVSLTGAGSQAAAQWLIGQGATGTNFDTLMGVMPSTDTIARPAINGTRPTIQGTLTLNGNNVRAQGLNLSTGAGIGINDAAGAVSGVSVSDMGVTSTTATAVNLSDLNGTVSLTSVSSNGAANGIVLNNTNAASGSFSVTGNGSSAGSGGTIQNTTASALLLTDASNVSLSNMNINDSALHGIQGETVSNLDLTGVNITGSGNAQNEHGIFITDLAGTGANTSNFHDLAISNTDGDTAILILQTVAASGELLIDGNTLVEDAREGGFEARTQNAGGQLDIIIGNTSALGVGDDVIFDNTLSGISVFAEQGTINGTVRNSRLQSGGGTATINRIGGSGTNGVLFNGVAGQSNSAAADINLTVTGTIIDHDNGGGAGTGASIIALSGNGNINGTFTNNTLNSDDEFVDGIFSNFTGVGSIAENRLLIDSNTINMIGSGGFDTIAGIEINAHNSAGNLAAVITDNTIFSAGDNGFSGGIVFISGDSGGGDSNTICADVRNNNSSAPSAMVPGGGDDYAFVAFSGTSIEVAGDGAATATIPEYIIASDAAGSTTTTTDVVVIPVATGIITEVAAGACN